MSIVTPKPIEFALPLPSRPNCQLHAAVTVRDKSLLVLLTTSLAGETAQETALGSFVYAIPNVCPPLLRNSFVHVDSFLRQRLDPAHPLTTPLCAIESSIDFATRLATILAKRCALPVYVADSMDLREMGGIAPSMVEEEMAVLRRVVEVVVECVGRNGR